MAHCDIMPLNNQGGILWLSRKINDQPLDIMLNSGATVCCLACPFLSSCLKVLLLQCHDGPGLLSANGMLMAPCDVITTILIIGNPAVFTLIS